MKPRTAAEILDKRHRKFHSWAMVSEELDGFNRGMLSAVARGKKKPSPRLIDLINHEYGVHIPYPPTRVTINTCPKCGQPHYRVTKRCPKYAPKYAPHPVIRLSKLRRLMQSPYNA